MTPVLLLVVTAGCSTVPDGEPRSAVALRAAAPGGSGVADRGGDSAPPGSRGSSVPAQGVWHDGLGEVVVAAPSPGESGDRLWGWDGQRWLPLGSSVGPGARLHPALAYDRTGDVLVLHGGRREPAGPLLGDTWSWDGTGWRRGGWMGPGVRWGHAMVWRSATEEIVLFGGASGTTAEPRPLADTWTRDGRKWTRRDPGTGPPGRWGHALAYDARRDRVVLFGGRGAGGLLGDTWEWDGMRWHRVEAAGPERPRPRAGARMAWDASREVLLLFGGHDAGGELADTWSWDGRRWRRAAVDAPSPPARSLHAMAYDPVRARIVVFGGVVPAGDPSAVWEWTGRSWVSRPPAP